VLDLRWLSPLDETAVAEALRASGGKLLIAHEANLTGGFGAEVAARISERHFYDLDAPIVRLGMTDVRVPSSPVLQAAVLPNEDTIAAAARLLARH
jgi:2-oxoisovalerate dehydrogenase E1 component